MNTLTFPLFLFLMALVLGCGSGPAPAVEEGSQRAAVRFEEEAPEVEGRVLFTLPWGEGAGALGMEDVGGRPGPMGFAVDRAGRVVVADSINGRVVRYSPSGDLLDTM